MLCFAKASEPYAGLEFSSANDACQFYQTYAEAVGFRVRIGQLFRSKVDGSITSRRFVCSKEGFQHPFRMGCGAYMRIKKRDSGGWIVDRLSKVEDQCRRLYTLTIFRIFQGELAQSYGYLGLKTYEEGAISRFLVRKCGNENEKHAVTFSASNLNASCSCQMFEYEGVLCRHVLKVFSLLDVRELPSRYILHCWTKNAEFGFVRDVESGVASRDLKDLMIWSLREAASKYIEFGTSSLEKYKLGYEIMREGGKKLCWQR